MGVAAIYAGTFDPITLGHSNIVERACKMYVRVVIAVAKSTLKNTMFDLSERIALVEAVFADLPQVEAQVLDGLLVDFCHHVDANVIVRGIRGVIDFDYEFQMTGMNRKMAPDVDTVFLTPDEGLAPISSTLVRQIASLGGDVSDFVDPLVADALRQKFE